MIIDISSCMVFFFVFFYFVALYIYPYLVNSTSCASLCNAQIHSADDKFDVRPPAGASEGFFFRRAFAPVVNQYSGG